MLVAGTRPSPLGRRLAVIVAAAVAFIVPVSAAPIASAAARGASVTALKLLPHERVLASGTGVQLTVIATLSNGTKRTVTGSARWRTSNRRVAKPARTGLVRTPRAGRATVTATYQGRKVSTRLVVRAGLPSRVTVTPGSATIPVGTQQRLVLKGQFRTFRQTLNSWATWSASPAGVVSVRGGSVTALAPGKATVRSTFKGRSTLATITVAANTVTASDRMETALSTNNPNVVSRQEIVAKAQNLLSTRPSVAGQLLPATGTSINWNPGSGTGHRVTSYAAGYQTPILVANHDFVNTDRTGDSVIALAGSTATSTTPMAYFALDPFVDRTSGTWQTQTDAGMNQVGQNTVSWLLGGSPALLATSRAKIVLANIHGGYEAQTRSWFTSRMPQATVNAVDSCDLPANTTCTNSANLLVVGPDRDSDPAKIADMVAAAYAAGTPVLFFGGEWWRSTPAALAAKFGMTTDDMYWISDGLVSSNRAEQMPGGQDAVAGLIKTILDRNTTSPFVRADYQACLDGKGDWAGCQAPAVKPYVAALRQMRDLIAEYDRRDATLFDGRRAPDSDLFRLVLMLADKARTGTKFSTRPDDDAVAVDYPVDMNNGAALARTLLSDSVMPTASSLNQAAADYGTVYCSRGGVVANSCAAPVFPHVGTHAVTRKATGRSEWQATGLTLVPGEPTTVTVSGDPGTEILVRTFFQRQGTTKSREVDGSGRSNYDRPFYLTTDWIRITPGKPTTISSPYGGPLYVNIAGSEALNGTPVPLTFSHVARHPAVLDMSDDAQIDKFVADMADGAYYVDLAGSGFEAHMPASYIKQRLTSGDNVAGRPISYAPAQGGLEKFLLDFRDGFVFSIYRQAGIAIGTTPLSSTVPADVQQICQTLTLPCLDQKLNSRTQIQHVNYDLRALCGNGCSGNPFDADWAPSPIGWGESHELGHNLQRGQLNVSWVDTNQGAALANRNLWTNYQGRSGEVSNNLFPSHTRWQYFRKPVSGQPGDTNPLPLDYSGARLFAVNQSARNALGRNGQLEVLGNTCQTQATFPLGTPSDVAISDTVWEKTDSNMRLSFYNEMPLMVAGKAMAGGTVLQDGWSIHTLLYQAARSWSQDTGSETSWTPAAQARHGMSLFAWQNDAVYGAGNRVNAMIGNDFMLIELSRISGYDWRPYFRQHGVQFTDLANQQVTANSNAAGGYKSFGNKLPLIDGQAPPADLADYPMVDLTLPTTPWPGAKNQNGTMADVNFHPSTCP